MKKLTTFALILVLTLMCATTVFAATEDELLDKLSATYKVAGEEVALSDSDIVKIERYLSENVVSAEDADAVIAKVDELVKYVNGLDIDSLEDMTAAQKEKALSIVNEAAAVLDLTITYDSTDKVLKVYDENGELVDTVKADDVLNTTGGVNALYIVLPVVAIIALAAAAMRLRK